MRVVNYTRLNLTHLLAFAARGVNDSGVEVHVKNEPHHPHGYAYLNPDRSICKIANTSRMLITLHLPSTPDAEIWPKEMWNGHGLKTIAKMYPKVPFDSWEDCVVYLAAHEFRHVWQKDRKVRMRLRTRQKGEHDAEKHAIRILNLWRESTGRAAIPRVKLPNPFERWHTINPPVSQAANPAPRPAGVCLYTLRNGVR